ncbi:Gfo/Idh/MocA family oxidoreductase [bacterium]|nr:Gfo/Idh/MocA family oxidoreductase [bacterium]
MLKVGIAGLRRGSVYLQVFNHLPETNVYALCDTDKDLLQSFASNCQIERIYPDYDEFIQDDFDIAVIATPLPLHYQQSVKALEAGKDVLCEVTSATTIEECENLIKTVEKTGKKYMLAENYNYMPFVETWRSIIKQGLIGKIIYAEGEYVHDCRSIMRDSEGRLTWRASLIPILYCTHNLGPLLSLMEDACISAIGLTSGVNVSPELGALDMTVALFETEKGAVMKFLAGFSIAKEPMHLTFSLYGTRGFLETDRLKYSTHSYLHTELIPNVQGCISITSPLSHPYAPAILGGHGTTEYVLAKDFVRSILEDSKPPIDVYEAVKYTIPGICAAMSIQEGGKKIEIPRLW